MSSYLLTAKINSLQAELDALYLQVQTAIFAAGLTNPLDKEMICGPWSILSDAPITTSSSINGGTINGGIGNFTTSIVTPAITGLDTLTLEDIKTGIIFPKITGGTITLQGDTDITGATEVGSLTTANTVTGKYINATTSGTMPTLSVDTLQTNSASQITILDPITSNYPITASAITATGNFYTASGSITGQYITGGVSVETQALECDTFASFNTGNIAVNSPIISISNITTSGALSSASLTVSGTSILPTITGGSSNLVNINSGINVPVGSEVKIRDALYLNEVRAINYPGYGTVNFDSDITMGDNGSASTNNVIDIGSLKMRPLNGTARNQDVVIRAPAVPGTTNGAIQVMVPLTDGSDGTYGTVYDTVYNIPPGVSATTLSAVLTAGSTAPTQSMTVAGITTQTITGASTNPDGAYLHCTTNLISDGNIYANNTTGTVSANNTVVSGYQALESVVNPEDYETFIRATNDKLQVQYGHLVNVPSSSPWGSIYDDYYNKPPQQVLTQTCNVPQQTINNNTYNLNVELFGNGINLGGTVYVAGVNFLTFPFLSTSDPSPLTTFNNFTATLANIDGIIRAVLPSGTPYVTSSVAIVVARSGTGNNFLSPIAWQNYGFKASDTDDFESDNSINFSNLYLESNYRSNSGITSAGVSLMVLIQDALTSATFKMPTNDTNPAYALTIQNANLQATLNSPSGVVDATIPGFV